MRRFRNHLIAAQQGSRVLFSHFEDGGAMWTRSGQREVRTRVTFDQPFRSIPVIVTGLAMFDIADGANLRVDLGHEGVDETGFDLVFRTWGDTRVARARADWTALGEMGHDDDWEID